MGLKFRRGTTAQKSGSLAFGEPYVNTDLGTLQIGGAAGDITLGASGTGSQGSFAGISGSSLNITGNAKVDGNLTLGGNITIGDNTADSVNVVASLSSSLIPSLDSIFDLGSPSKQWRDLYLSSASLYIDGTQVLSSNATELIFTTDTGQSIKFNELGTDNIVLQTVDGDIELKSSGGGDLLLDPTSGLISIKGNVSMQDGTAKFLSSGGSKIVFGNDIELTGSIVTTGNINGLNLTTLSSSISTTLGELRIATGSSTTSITNLNSATASLLIETANLELFSGSALGRLSNLETTSASLLIETANLESFTSSINTTIKTRLNAETVVSGSSQITYASISSIPASIVSGSSQVTLSSTTGYGTVINQNLLTTSNVQHASLGIGMAASGTAGRIDASNDVVAFSTSDIRFKENIVPIENALDKISKISGNTYDWKAENKVEHGYEGNDVGVIAQEIEAVLPQLVQTRENGFKAVKYDKLVALLIEGIKEQQTQIHSLTIEIEKLKESKGL